MNDTSKGPSVQFTTDSTDDGALVLFDCIDSGAGWETYVAHDDWSLGAPDYEGDPDGYGNRYGLREVTFTIVIEGAKTPSLRIQRDLSRVLLRPRGFLRFQVSQDQMPVWLELLRPRLNELSFEDVYKYEDREDQWRMRVTLPARDFGIGERVWLLGSPTQGVTLGNDPTNGGVMLDLPEIPGDAETPLRIDVVPSVPWDGHETTMSVTALDEPDAYPDDPIVWRAAALSAGVDTGPVVSSAQSVGGQHRVVTFASNAGMATRLSGVVPAAPPIGRYCVYARVGRSDDASAFELRFGQDYGLNNTHWGAPVRYARGATDGVGDGHRVWVLLGDFTFPLGADPSASSAVGAATTPSVQLQASRVAGTGSAIIDALGLIPVNVATARRTTTRRTLFGGYGIGPDRSGVWDGERGRFTAYDHGSTMSQGLTPQSSGMPPSAVPGCRNVLHLLQQTYPDRPFFGALPNGDHLDASVQLKVSCQPRLLNLPSRG